MDIAESINFVIRSDNDETIMFKFKPQQSSCHSFNETPPKSWEEVYKVYYTYDIIKTYHDDCSTETMFSCFCDECSAIPDVVAKFYKNGFLSLEDYPNNEMCFQAIAGVEWTLKYNAFTECIEFSLFNMDNKGFRFSLTTEKATEFIEYLKDCCDYTLAHGEGI